MATQKFTGKHQLIKRLAAQVGDKGMAIAILKKRGDITTSGKRLTLTKKGHARDNMTAAQRDKNRAATASGKSSSDYKYNPKTNAAKLKGK